MWACPINVGQRIDDVLQLTAEQIVAGARLLGDANPLHNDADAARASRFGSLIACGPHAAGLHACMLPTYITSLGFGVVGIEFTVQYRRPVYVDIPYMMWWQVEVTRGRGSNWRIDWIGAVEHDEAPSITGTGSVLILSA